MIEHIELEYRSEIDLSSADSYIEKLKKLGKLVSNSRRLSFTAFGDGLDVRVRITNGKSEVVLKKGDWHAENRIEIPQCIQNDEFVGFVKIFATIISNCKIGERENFIFETENDITITLVKARYISYIEFEKISNEENIEQNRKELLEILDKNGFDNLCDRLNEKDD